MTAPQDEIFAVVDARGDLRTESGSNRWAFKEPQSAKTRAMLDYHQNPQLLRKSRVARYKFDGWIE